MTHERQLAIRNFYDAYRKVDMFFYSGMVNDNQDLEHLKERVQRFEMAISNMILENKQKDGVAV